jgi:hypothetical protein
MVERKTLENLERDSVLRYHNGKGNRAYFVVSEVKEGKIYGTIVNTSIEGQGSVSIGSVLGIADLEIATNWKKLR